jgi:CHAD domain-containing protein
VPEPISLWQLRALALTRARKAVRRQDPEGLHDLRVGLRRLAATAGALGRDGLSRDAKSIARSLSKPRQLEVDQQLLTRVRRLGLLSPDSASALAARWEKLAGRGERRLARAAGKPVEALVKRLNRLSDKSANNTAARIERERYRAQKALARPLDGRDERMLHRYRVGVKRARYLAEDLAALGVHPWRALAERERALQEALGRWNDLRLFCERLAVSRQEAQERGAVTLVREIDRLLSMLVPTIASCKRAALEASKNGAGAAQRKRAPSRGQRSARGK